MPHGLGLHAEVAGGVLSGLVRAGLQGWVAVPSRQHLIGAGMIGGAPETATSLMPDKEAKGKQTVEFVEGDGQRWLWCLYGGMRLVHRLGDKAISCTVTTKTTKPENSLSAAVVCT